MVKVGVKEMRDKFSHYLKLVRGGKEVIITERGKAIAMLKPLHEESSLEEKLARLEARGILSIPQHWGFLTSKPIPMEGKSLTKVVLEEREEGW